MLVDEPPRDALEVALDGSSSLAGEASAAARALAAARFDSRSSGDPSAFAAEVSRVLSRAFAGVQVARSSTEDFEERIRWVSALVAAQAALTDVAVRGTLLAARHIDQPAMHEDPKSSLLNSPREALDFVFHLADEQGWGL